MASLPSLAYEVSITISKLEKDILGGAGKVSMKKYSDLKNRELKGSPTWDQKSVEETRAHPSFPSGALPGHCYRKK